MRVSVVASVLPSLRGLTLGLFWVLSGCGVILDLGDQPVLDPDAGLVSGTAGSAVTAGGSSGAAGTGSVTTAVGAGSGAGGSASSGAGGSATSGAGGSASSGAGGSATGGGATGAGATGGGATGAGGSSGSGGCGVWCADAGTDASAAGGAGGAAGAAGEGGATGSGGAAGNAGAGGRATGGSGGAGMSGSGGGGGMPNQCPVDGCPNNFACVSGTCSTSQCAAGYDRICAGKCIKGCCSDANCPVRPHAQASCNSANGQCSYTCDNNYGDCDNDDTTGCEVDLRVGKPVGDTVQHCGACGAGRTCGSLAGGGRHAKASCVNKACVPSCDADAPAEQWRNCSGVYSDGCNVNILGSKDNCGGCNDVCKFGNDLGTSDCRNPLTSCNLGRCDALMHNGSNEAYWCAVRTSFMSLWASDCDGGCYFQCDAGHYDCDRDFLNGCEGTNQNGTDCSAFPYIIVKP